MSCNMEVLLNSKYTVELHFAFTVANVSKHEEELETTAPPYHTSCEYT